jgi:GNAT superfamily N-acetyltransferase
MDKITTFPIPLAGYRVEGFVLEDAPRLQPLYIACTDYVMLEQGVPPTPTAAEEEFYALPPNRTAADKFIFGLLNEEANVVGVLECNRGYPEERCWWVGLLMIDPAERGKGVAHAFFQAFVAWVEAQKSARLELAVITTNTRAYRFWQSQGFEVIRTTDPLPYGINQHTLHVMRRWLSTEDS